MYSKEDNVQFFTLLGGLETREVALKKLAGKIKNKECILDLATGSGYLVRNLLDKEGPTVCLDLDVGSLLKTKKELPGMAYVRGDALHLPFKELSFDCVISWSALVHIGDWKGVIKEAFKASHKLITAEPHGDFQVRAFRDFRCKHKCPGKKELLEEFEKYGKADIENLDFISIITGTRAR
jgi:hypothetical protein